jgi:hypothetical protein
MPDGPTTTRCPGAESLAGHIAFYRDRVAVERI